MVYQMFLRKLKRVDNMSDSIHNHYYDKRSEITLLNLNMVAGRLCGSPGENQRRFMSTGRHMTVRFITDENYTDKGFRAQYNAIGNDTDLNICKLVVIK